MRSCIVYNLSPHFNFTFVGLLIGQTVVCLLLAVLLSQCNLSSPFTMLRNTILPTALPLHSGQPKGLTLNTTGASSSTGRAKRLRGVGEPGGDSGGEDSNSGNPKKRRNIVYHPHTVECQACVLWRQSGMDPNLKHLHPQTNSRHAGSEAFSLSQYASYQGTHFDLTSDDCVCQPCYKDFKRKTNQENQIPRWARLQQQHYSIRESKHCIYCCEGECTCTNIHQWGPDQWHGEDTLISTWKRYLSLSGNVQHPVGSAANHVCRTHYRRIFKLRETRACSVCKSSASSSWSLVCDVVPSPDIMSEAFQLEPGSIHFFAWICKQCSLCYQNDARLEGQLDTDTQSPDPTTAGKSKLLLSVLDTLRTDGVVFTKDVMTQFKGKLADLNVANKDHNQMGNTFRKYLTTLCTRYHHYKVFVPAAGMGNYGRTFYDDRKFSTHAITHMFQLKQKEWNKKTTMSIEHLQDLIRQQISLFPVSKVFDYTSLISEENGTLELDEFFIPELYKLMEACTTSKNSAKRSSSTLYKDLRKARIRMAISILCLAMNPQCCFMQTITGLLCYAYGLRDKGFEALNTLGCCCSIDHVRAHGAYWASRREPIQNLDGTKPWRISIDNLNFNMKYAKNLPESAAGANKMLNLMTCQVSHRVDTHPTCGKPKQLLTLKDLVFKSMRDSQETSQARHSVALEDFNNRDNTPESFYLQYFLAICHDCTVKRLAFKPTLQPATFLEAVQNYMPHWTPPEKDNVVYATIDEASSGNITDIEGYLSKIKRDLHIGQPGYPEKVALAGDQQTYALMKELQRQHPTHYRWMVVLHGDWHTLKLVAEMIRDILWDGGFRQLCSECGHKKLPTQWQEVHMLLLALYQALLHKAVVTYNQLHDATVGGHKPFWDWLTKIASDANKDENSRFWSRMIPFLNGYFAYFISVRSGNWVLRNSAIRALLPLFFAYNHYKYEELATTAVIDTLTLPDDVLAWFVGGGWTASVKARPHHNLALDEAHESLINLRLKTITSRPSHFRTVEMSNFMSYLDTIVRGMEGQLYAQKEHDPVQQRKRYVCQRADKMITMLSDMHIFEQHEEQIPLCNIISPAKHPLDSKTISDLLNISSIGKERMATFVEEHILPVRTGGRKRRKRPRKLATFTGRSSTTSEGKRRENELSNIARNAMQILQANGITAQTSPHPLAIADLDGNMRTSSKCKYLETLSKCLDFEDAVSETCKLFSNPVSDLCVIVDMLYFLHMPPPPTEVTFLGYFEHLWRQTVGKYAIHKGAAHIYLVFDKQNFLPPPRNIVHKSRGAKAGNAIPDPTITEDAAIPHSNTYSSLLAKSSTFRSHLLEFMTSNFKAKATKVTTMCNFSVTIDSSTCVVTVSNGQAMDKAGNEHGEADYAIWHHSIRESSAHILIVSRDTDTWVYGLGLYEQQRHLVDKQVFVQRGNTESYIDMRAAAQLVCQHPKLSALSYPALSIVALYILTGCDYVSSFYRCTKTAFLETLLQDSTFICPDGNLLKMIEGEFQCINEEAWVRLATAVYYNKYKQFFRQRPIGYTSNLIAHHMDSPEAQRMLTALNYTPTSSSQLQTWHQFIRRVTYHVPKVTKYHEHKLLPTYQALVLHCKRADYVLKLTMSAPWMVSPFLPCYQQFGWHMDREDGVTITWDAALDSEAEEDSDSEADGSDGDSNSSECDE